LGDSALRCRLASAGRQLIEEEFDIHKTTAVRRGLFGVPNRENAAVLQEVG